MKFLNQLSFDKKILLGKQVMKKQLFKEISSR